MFADHKHVALLGLVLVIVAAAPAVADVLIYWDQSANSEIDVEAAEYVAAQHDEEVTLVTDARAFVRELEYVGWSYVVVAKEHTSDTTSYSEALAAYADYYGNVYWNVSLDISGRSVSVAFATWWRGRTTVGYAGAGSRSAWTVDGYNVPDFAHVNLDDCATAVTPELRFRPIDDDVEECKDDCLTRFGNAISVCDDQRDVDFDNCEAAYPDHGDEYDNCMQKANEDHGNCMKAALNRLRTCYALCDAENEGPVGEIGPAQQASP